MDPVANEYKLEHAGRIAFVACKVRKSILSLTTSAEARALKATIITLFSAAVVTVFIRTIIRVHTRRRLYLDDLFVFIGLLCLSGATGLVLPLLRDLFLIEAVLTDPTYIIFPSDLTSDVDRQAILDFYLALAWTTTYCVKFSFLALFRLLIGRISNWVTIYFRFAVVATVLTAAFVLTQPFIICPHFGLAAGEPVVLIAIFHSC